jgi:hypothetical protein
MRSTSSITRICHVGCDKALVSNVTVYCSWFYLWLISAALTVLKFYSILLWHSETFFTKLKKVMLRGGNVFTPACYMLQALTPLD